MEHGNSPVVGVGAVITNNLGEVVLVRRGLPPRAGQWSIPGGKLEWGERVTDAVLREIREETGLIVELGKFALKCATRELIQWQRFFQCKMMGRELDRAATGPRWLEDERVAQSVADACTMASGSFGYTSCGPGF